MPEKSTNQSPASVRWWAATVSRRLTIIVLAGMVLLVAALIYDGQRKHSPVPPLTENQEKWIQLTYRIESAVGVSLYNEPIETGYQSRTVRCAANAKLQNAEFGKPLPENAIVWADLYPDKTDIQSGIGLVRGTYNTQTRQLHLELTFGPNHRTIDYTFLNHKDLMPILPRPKDETWPTAMTLQPLPGLQAVTQPAPFERTPNGR